MHRSLKPFVTTSQPWDLSFDSSSSLEEKPNMFMAYTKSKEEMEEEAEMEGQVLQELEKWKHIAPENDSESIQTSDSIEIVEESHPSVLKKRGAKPPSKDLKNRISKKPTKSKDEESKHESDASEHTDSDFSVQKRGPNQKPKVARNGRKIDQSPHWKRVDVRHKKITRGLSALCKDFIQAWLK